MSWFKDNPFLAGLTTVTLVGAGALGYLIAQSAGTYATAAESYEAAVAKLHTLQNKVPFPSQENLKAMQANIEGYAARISALQAQLAAMEIPLDESVTPQQFQDGLRTAVNDLRKSAEGNGVKIPENFYFGFDQYQSQVPTDQAAPALYRQFRVIQALVSRLVDFKVASIDAVVRPPIAEESGPRPAAPAQPNKTDSGKPGAAPAAGFTRMPFDVSFTADPSKVRVAYNSLLAPEQFLIIRSVSLQNSSPTAPPKVSAEAAPVAAASLFAPEAGSKDGEKKSLQVILGRELLKVTLHLEMLDFPEPQVAKK